MVALPLPKVPEEIGELKTLALDLRWTWSHESDALWARINQDLWQQTQNPWNVLQTASSEHLKLLAKNKSFREAVEKCAETRRHYLERETWFTETYGQAGLRGVAYFSMEFGLGAALPFYAGGLGILAGDYLKAASDLGVPLVGVGLLYQEGYFRQALDSDGKQQEFYPYNEPAAMPVQPVILPDGSWLRIALEMPGRTVQLRVWEALVGRIKLYLLDSNDLQNSPVDRGITTKLYGGGAELRLMQEIILGVGGWRVVDTLHPEFEVCHVNEGHAAFAIIERARSLALKCGIHFWEAIWATRASNVFTTHTPVGAGFDRFPATLLRKYLPYIKNVLGGHGVELSDVLALGRLDPRDETEEFNMAYLALRGSAMTVGVSRLHGEFSRRIFQPLFPRWPVGEVPVSHITNGVHVPTWDSVEADRIWTEACGKDRWRTIPGLAGENLMHVPDESLWAMRGSSRQRMVKIVRDRLFMQLRERGFSESVVSLAETAFDPNVLTLGFARRFTEYKRPNLLLRDTKRFMSLLADARRPVQIVVAGKAHPADVMGKDMIRRWIEFASQPEVRQRVAFLEDYDIDLAQVLIQGVDVWINTPRRPWEACGTSGMKVLVNGGLNCSSLDGWWDEAHDPEVGWTIGNGHGGPADIADAEDAESLYHILETQIIPEFYDRDAIGLPRAWLARIRKSMAQLTSAFSSTRMMRDYIEQCYLPLVKLARDRIGDNFEKARHMNQWSRRLHRSWPTLHIGSPVTSQTGDGWQFFVPVYMGDVPPSAVRVEIFAEPLGDNPAEVVMLHREQPIVGSSNGFIYAGEIKTSRPIGHYTARVVPYHPDAALPAELPLITWEH